MNNTLKLSLIVMSIIVVFLTSCMNEQKQYFDDITVQLTGREGEIIIKEWSYLLGSGADIYYREEGETTYLGKTTGGDDGYCPFNDGQYELKLEGDTIQLRWQYRGNGNDKTLVEKEFVLP